MTNATHRYLTDEYGNQHPDWHLTDAPGKAEDLMESLLLVIEARKSKTFRIADIGAGVGGVLSEVSTRIAQKIPDLDVEAVGFEVAPYAIEICQKLFPTLEIHQKLFDASDGPFDAVLFVDVLEHLENPWEMLRNARQASEYMIVRQPLLEGFSTFRHNNYKDQRQHWGHISYFNYHSFMDMAEATGWKPVKVNLLASWELNNNQNNSSKIFHRLLVNVNRKMASYFLSGFYLNGVFRRF